MSECIGSIDFLSLGIWLTDLTRPFGILTSLIFIIFFICKRSYKFVIASLIGISLALPYHVVHFKKTGNYVLSNFTGCFMAEVYLPEKYKRPSTLDRSFSSQIEILKICDKAKGDIIEEYFKSKPLLTIKKIFNINLLARKIFPPAFTPYQDTPNIFSARGLYQWSITFILFLFYLSTIWIFLFSIINSDITISIKIIFSFAVFVPLLSSLVANSGIESLRHTLHFYLPLLFLGLQIGIFNIQKKIFDNNQSNSII